MRLNEITAGQSQDEWLTYVSKSSKEAHDNWMESEGFSPIEVRNRGHYYEYVWRNGVEWDYSIDGGADKSIVIESGMPASIIKAKQAYAMKTPEELLATFTEVSQRTGKPIQELAISAARRHGLDPNTYWNRIRSSNLEEAIHYKGGILSMKRGGWIAHRDGKQLGSVVPTKEIAQSYLDASYASPVSKMGSTIADTAVTAAATIKQHWESNPPQTDEEKARYHQDQAKLSRIPVLKKKHLELAARYRARL